MAFIAWTKAGASFWVNLTVVVLGSMKYTVPLRSPEPLDFGAVPEVVVHPVSAAAAAPTAATAAFTLMDLLTSMTFSLCLRGTGRRTVEVTGLTGP
jgi:hypothetical protein